MKKSIKVASKNYFSVNAKGGWRAFTTCAGLNRGLRAFITRAGLILGNSLLLLFFIFLHCPLFASQTKPAYDIVVAADGTGNYRTIGEAINAIKDSSEKRILVYIKNGVYKEKLLIPTSKTNVTFLGENVNETIITYDDHKGKGDIETPTSYTVFVLANDFRAENITFENSAGRFAGQAVGLRVDGDRCEFVNCRIVGNQDILLTNGKYARQYYLNCYIEGTTDFIFGPSTAVFDKCIIVCKKNSYITAASTPEDAKYGYVFLHCTIKADSSYRQVYLGRPWRPYAKVVYIDCWMGGHIQPEGWHNWNTTEPSKTAFYAEYKNTGPGYQPESRVGWSHQLTDAEAKEYTVDKIFGDWKPGNH